MNTAPTYPDDLVSELCDIVGIGHDRTTEVQEALNEFAKDWHAFSTDPRRLTTRKEHNTQLEKVECAARALKEAIDEMSLSAWESFQHFGKHMDILSGTIVAKEPAELLFDYSCDAEIRVAQQVFSEFLASVAETAVEAASYQPSKPGRSPNVALLKWVDAVRAYLLRQHDINFSRNASVSGGPITPTERFCVGAFQHLSPGTGSHTILNNMRTVMEQEPSSIRWFWRN